MGYRLHGDAENATLWVRLGRLKGVPIGGCQTPEGNSFILRCSNTEGLKPLALNSSGPGIEYDLPLRGSTSPVSPYDASLACLQWWFTSRSRRRLIIITVQYIKSLLRKNYGEIKRARKRRRRGWGCKDCKGRHFQAPGFFSSIFPPDLQPKPFDACTG